ncbi:hypothetical protein VNO78_12270 [Psophocarpus tetragonolobus]|uniref:TIR domain-containing protein n=1 Tax=Psophocarpus tetragonolobus TaxID=3891 RepID=A0AAN9XP45_PSOTE
MPVQENTMSHNTAPDERLTGVGELMSDNNTAPQERLTGVEELISDNNTPHINYDVFVNFRGEIRCGFLSHLIEEFKRNGITAFVDDKLERGREIGPSFVGAIKGSSISLVIFSPKYAFSHWCLEELVTILKSKEEQGQIVIPIFYKLEPTDVGHQSSDDYKQAFSEHERKYDKEVVQIWRNALKRTAKISGIVSSNYRNEADLTKEIAELVVKRLNNKPWVISEKLVGIDEILEELEALIRKEPKDTRLIGIWGMGGIGKTTLAEEIFGKLRFEYQGSYLLRDVTKEASCGISSLRKDIISGLLGKYVTDDRICGMKVLIVLDDVNDLCLLEKLLGRDYQTKFASGSRIIVTSRDKQVLIANKVEDDNIYELRELNLDKAVELFNLNAFDHNDLQSGLQSEFHELSTQMVEYAKGIPLVLEVVARLLRGKKEKDIWKSLLHKIKTEPVKEVHALLKLSYDNLDRKEKQIFLDLACFIVRLYRKVNLGVLKSLLKDGKNDNSVDADLERLKDKALITFSKDNFISMHDCIQAMGLEIVRECHHNNDLRPYTWFWDTGDFCKALKDDKGVEIIRSIQIDLTTTQVQTFSHDTFTKMRELQLLDIYSGCNQNNVLTGEGLLSLQSELRFLCCYCCSLKCLPENFKVEKLVILKLPFSKLEKLWDGVKNLVNLKELDINSSQELKELPDLSKAANLEVLILLGCVRLSRLHPSIFSLSKLGKLDLWDCNSLDILGTYYHLRGLKYLNHDELKNFREFELILEIRPIRISPFSRNHDQRSSIYVRNDLERLPSVLYNLTRLLRLEVTHCRKTADVKVTMTVTDGNYLVQHESARLYVRSENIESDHVCVICDNSYLICTAQTKTRFKIRLDAEAFGGEGLQADLKGFGASPIHIPWEAGTDQRRQRHLHADDYFFGRLCPSP